MTTQQGWRNIKLYGIFWLLKEPLFWGPIVITFIQSISKMSLSEVYFMESACIIVAILLQAPTGALADKLGRKKTMIIGELLLVIMTLMFAAADSKLEMWLANIVAFAGYAFVGGADKALLYDSLKFLGLEKEHRRIIGKFYGRRFILVAGCSIAVGWLAEINIRIPLYMCLPPMAANLILVFFLTEPPHKNEQQKRENYFLFMLKSIVFVANHRAVKWTIAFTALVAMASKLWFFSYNPYFELVGLRLSDFGYIFAALNLVSALSSWLAHKIHHHLGDVGSQVMIVSCLFIPLMLMGAFPIAPFAWLVIVQNIVRGYLDPFMTDFLNQHLDSENRATVLSIGSGFSQLIEMFSLSGFGMALGILPLTTCLQLLGLTVLILGTILLMLYFKIFPQSATS